MDEREPDNAGRPLTRRELRLRDAAAAAMAAGQPAAVQKSAPVPDEDGAVGEPAVASPTPEAGRWRALAAWSLHHELPAGLPEEQEDDDVHWHVEPEAADGPAASDDADAAHQITPVEPLPDEALPAEGEEGMSFEDIVMPPSIPPRGAVPRRRSVWQVDDEAADDESATTSPPQWTPVAAGGTDHDENVSAAAHSARADLLDLLPPIPEPDGVGDHVEPEPPDQPEQDAEAVASEQPEQPEQPDQHADPVALADEPLARHHAEPVTQAAAVPGPPDDERRPDDELPTLSDLLAARPVPAAGPALLGWRGALRRITGGLLHFAPGSVEREQRAAIGTVQRHLDGPRTIVVINPKGGAHKTTGTLLLAAAFGQHRGGYTLAWDNNETRGTLGWRSLPGMHQRTAVDLLQDLDRFTEPGAARVGDLDGYVRSQGSAQFDVLASDEDAASAASIDGFAFRALHRTLSRFYRVMVVDTGNNMRASNWQAAIEAADQVVIVSTVREDTAQSAAWAIDALRATGHAEAVRNAVTVLSDPGPQRDEALVARLHEHFGRLTRAVVDVPYDASLVGGSPLQVDQLDRRTREAWLRVAAVVAEGL